LAAASSGPKRRLSNVHNGLVEVALCGPTASGGVVRTLAPEGKLTLSALSPYEFLCLQETISCVPQQNASPVRQMLCKITANLRASATRALFVPDRLAIFIAQILRTQGPLDARHDDGRCLVQAEARERVATLRYMSTAVDIARLISPGGESQVRADQA